MNSILRRSAVDAGNLSFDEVAFDLSEVLKACSAVITSTIERKGLQLEMLTHTNVWRYWIGDAQRLRQVLLSLLANAVKFTDQGRISLTVGPARGDRGESGLRFEVDDTGCGIPREKVGTIFEALPQSEGFRRVPGRGMGAGLAFVRALVEKMSGTIWLDEKSGPGSRFVFTAFLPRTTAEAVTAPNVQAVSAKAVRQPAVGTRILIVEDNAENVILLRVYLDHLSLSLDFAENGQEALEKRSRSDHDLILMDMQMPVMDGYTATREIRSWEKANCRRRAPIVALTANAPNGPKGSTIEAGCDGHLTKPVNRNDLLGAIADFAHTANRGRPDAVVVPLSTPTPANDGMRAHRATFLANRWRDLEKLRTNLVAKDFGGIRTIAHNCKGIGTGYGFPEISSLGAEISRAAKAFDIDDLQRCFEDLKRCLSAASER